MKKIYLFASLFIALMGNCLADERTDFNAGKRQELLAPAAAMALEEENIQLLETLKDSGWNPSLVLGTMPDKDRSIKQTPLTFTCLLNNIRSLEWLIHQCKLSPDARDGNLCRPIDILLEHEKDSAEALKLIERKSVPKESDAFEEIACLVIRKFGPKACLKTVNGSAPSNAWSGFDALIQKMSALENDHTKLQAPPLPIAIEWIKIGETAYKFHIQRASESWGGGTKGEMHVKYGFWVPKDLEFFDS